MDGAIKTTEKLSPLKQAFLALEKAEAKLAAIESERTEAIAIIGIGCRFPGGASNPLAFWKNLCDGRNSVTEVPRDRWDIDSYYDPDPETPGKMSTRSGAFIESVDHFDAEFFGITPREARSMDPQQRILMEVVWQALEDAGHASLEKLEGSSTGVFVGVTTDDYAHLMMEAQGLKGIDTYFVSGTARSIVSGRISYQLGLVGPAVSLDTACSSSLLAVHQACRSLLDQECRMAIAAGVNIILSPANTVALSNYQMMAPDGRCKVFDAAADGFVRGEGCGVVVLKRLSDALADRDHIYALILGTAANQDGPSSGLTAPNGPSQEVVMRAALKCAHVKPIKIGYVEAHGTGTALGDPIEVRALGECYSEGRPADRPLVIGSVKTNIGHLEAAAGIAGLIKTALVLHHGEIPPNLHFKTPNPEIPWDRYTVMVPTRRMALATDGNRALAAVTSLGFSGTNVHAVLSSAPVQPATQASLERPLHVITLSARSPEALRQQAESLSQWIESTAASVIPNAAYTLGAGRTHYPHRIALVGGSPRELKRELEACLNGQQTAVRSGNVADAQEQPRVAFLFTGQGAQYAGMGRALEQHHPHFRASIDECDAILQPLLGRSIREILYPSVNGDAERINQTIYTQPALFALEYALAKLWWSWGVRPSHVLGHSLGEYVAACIAGILTLEDALQIVVQRAQLMQSISVPGGMAAVMASEEEVARRLVPHAEFVSIAAVNGPKHVVISGAAASLKLILGSLHEEGISVIPLKVSHAYHSPLMEPILGQFEKSIAGIRFHPPKLHLVSNVSGSVTSCEEVGNPRYWRRHARQAVRFSDGMRTLADQGCRLFIEIGPQPVLLNMGRQCLDRGEFTWLPSLDGKTDDWERILVSLADAYTAGVAVDWEGFDKPFDRRRISLPTYPFQRRQYWFSQSSAPGARQLAPLDPSQVHSGHPLLGMRMDSATGRIQFRSRIGMGQTAFFKDHRVSGTSSLPMAAVLEAALAAARLLWPDCAFAQLEQVSMDRAIRLPEDAGIELEWMLEPRPESGYTFQLFSRAEGPSTEGQWQQHAAGTLRPAGGSQERQAGTLPPEPLDAVQRRCRRKTDATDFYAYFSRIGLDFGPSFRTLETLWAGNREALGRLRPQLNAADANLGFALSPLILDGALQVIAAALMEGKFEDQARVGFHLPVGMDHAMLAHFTDGAAWAHAALRKGGGAASRSVVCDVRLLDDQSREIAVLSGCRLVPVDADVLKSRTEQQEERLLYDVRWRPRPECKTVAAEPTEATEFDFPLQALPERLNALLPQLAHAQRFEQYESARADMDALVSLYIMRTLEQLGWQPVPGDRVKCDSLAAQLNVAARHRQLLKRFLDILAEDGVLESAGDGWKVLSAFTGGDPSLRGREILDSGTSGAAELDLIVRCGGRLAEALRGVADPLDLLYRGDAFASVVRLYSESATARVFNGLVKEAVTEVLRDWPPGRRLRVLEIGAGTGGTTQYVLEALAGRDVSYLFTDISPAFVQAARERFQHHPGFRSQVLDIEKDPAYQGLAKCQFDLVIAANVLHATGDLADTLRCVHTMAAPGGLLVLLEVTAPQRWVDITFGLTEGWWKFTDHERRRDYPLLSSLHWKSLLAETGFPEALAVPSPDHPAPYSTLQLLSLIVARRDSASLSASIHPEVGATEHQNWLVLADNDGSGPGFCDRLRERNIRTSLVIRGQSFPVEQQEAPVLTFNEREDFEILFRQLRGRGAEWTDSINSKIVVLWGVNPPFDAPGEIDPLVRQKALLVPVLQLLQTITERGIKHPPKLIIVTRAAQAVMNFEPVKPGGAALWGMIRAVMLEHPELRCKLIDIDAETTMDRSGPFLAECAAEDAENQVAIRGEARYVPRLEPLPKDAVSAPSDADLPHQLDITQRGLFENLFWRKAARRSPGKGQVKINVAAAGLNFRDVLNALGTYAGGPVPFGGECAGTLVETGETVDDLKPGDRVLAIASHSFSSEAIADSRLVWRIPDGMKFEQAAALPIAYTTAAYALQRLAGLRPGQRILIHAAAGGVGLAAVHLARQAGAQLFVTAGSPEKRTYLEKLGIPHVMNSRTLEFAGTIMADTRGEGVDVVLNSLAGDFIERSLAVTAQGGTFLELGRSGIWSREEVEHSRPDIAYHAIDLTEDMAQRPETVRPLFDAVLEQIAAGSLPPLPCKVFSKDAEVDAFRYMARARQIGKIVLSWPGRQPFSQDMPLVRPGGTYWVTGGLGALGLFTAGWLAERGAGHIVLTGRNLPTPVAEKKLAEIRQNGAGVTVMVADVSLRDDVERVLNTIRKDCPPLRGIFHAAGVLDDGVLRHQSWERFETVLRPKVTGAWNLHQATRNLSLDFMVLYSSVAGLLGSPGQANHCAANAFMDSLAHMRQGKGLPCLSINWGAWAEAGAAVAEGASSRAALKGVGLFSPETGLQLLERLIRTDKTQAVALLVDWRKYIRYAYPDGSPVPLLDGVAAPGLPEANAPALRKTPTPGLMLKIQSAPATQKVKMLTACVHREALRILGLDPSDTLDLEKPLNDLGLDSLMAVELRNALGRAVERTLPATLLFDYPSINSVTNYLAGELNLGPVQPSSPAATGAGVPESTEDLLRRIEAMQDDDIDRLFSQETQDRN